MVLLQSATMTVLKIILIIRGKYLLVIKVFRLKLLEVQWCVVKEYRRRRQFANEAGKKKEEKTYHLMRSNWYVPKVSQKFVVRF